MYIYSNRNLELIKETIQFHNPCFISGDWYWLADATFAAWAIRVLRRAISDAAATPAQIAALDEIVAYNASLGVQRATIESLAVNPVKLAPIPAIYFAPMNFAPWLTFEADLKRFGPPEPAAPKTAPPADVASLAPARPAPARRRQTAARADLFASTNGKEAGVA